PAHELARDAVRFIRHHAAHHDLVAALGRPVEDRVARRVGALAYGAQIRNRENPDSHFLMRCGTNGILTTSAATFLPRTSISIFVPGFARSAGKYVVPIAACAVGVTVPLRTISTCVPSRNTGYPWRATVFGSLILNPTSRRFTPSSFCFFSLSSPVNGAPLSSFTMNASPASYGVVVSSMSLP